MKSRRREWVTRRLPVIGLVVAAAAVLVLGIAVGRETAIAQGIPGIPHGGAGQERCLQCHVAGGIKPVPGNHVGYTEATCQGCHRPAAQPAPAGSTAAAAPAVPPPRPAQQPPAVQPAAEACQTCHGRPGLSSKLAGGEELPLFVDSERYGRSVHGANFACANCHDQISGFPHPPLGAKSMREYALAQGETCRKCHPGEYSSTRDSVHTRLLAEGRKEAPVCSDCHGSHYIQGKQSKTEISRTCSTCHSRVYGGYADSVHGKALAGEGIRDVPVCSDCHKSHDIRDPRTLTFHYQSVDICAACHASPEIAAKYGLSADVVKNYLQDFHGAAVSLRQRELKSELVSPQTFVPVCTDCHGVHDIRSIKDPESSVFKTNLIKTCRRCHPDASDNFPSAWLSHYEPSWDQARLIFVVRSVYRVFIPFVVIGLVLHIAVDLWRAVKKR
ncbi:MAG: cytochrome c3 family protein [Chloroflexi bacterium]|nr:cytochrome c3 family protein [Chloroflexota bacterium]